MALTTKTLTANGSRGNHKFTLTINEDSTSLDNYSLLSFTFKLEDIKSGYDWYYTSSVPVTYTITIGDNTYSGNIMSYDGTSTVTLLSKSSIRVNHNSDGTKTINCSFSVSDIGKSFLPGSASSNSTMTLTTIYRQAKIVYAPQFYDDEKPTVTYSNPAGNAVTSLEIGISADGSIMHIPYREISKTGTSYTFNFTDAEIYSLWNDFLKNHYYADAYFMLKTVIGGNTLVNEYRGAVELRNGKPVLAPVVEDINTNTVALTGSATTIIKGASAVKVTANATAQKGATIKKYAITNGDITLDTSEATFNNVENPEFTIVVTDDRGQTTKETITLDMVNYYHPTVNLVPSVELIGETTARITLNISGNYYNGSFGAKNNTLGVNYNYKLNNSAYVGWARVSSPTISNGKYTATATIDVDYKATCTVCAAIQDRVNPNGIYSIEIPVKIIPVFDWGEDDFNFNVPVTIQGDTLNDYVVEQGTASMGSNGVWYWSKWKSGRAECYGCRNYGNMAVTTAWGSLYRSEAFTQSLPTGLFSTTPEVIEIACRQSNYGSWVAMHETSTPTTSKTGSFIIVRPASATLQQAYISFNVIGRWK